MLPTTLGLPSLPTPTGIMAGFTMEGRLALEPKPQSCGPAVNPESVHEAEAIAAVTKALGAAPRIRLDEARKIYVATVEATAERAKLSGEWTTKLGAIRRLRNSVRSSQDTQVQPTAQPQRPEPGGGSTSMLDSMAARRHVEKPSLGRSIKRGLSLVAYGVATLVVVLVAWEWFVRDAITPVRRPAPIVVHAAVPEEPVVAPVPVPEPVLPRRRVATWSRDR